MSCSASVFLTVPRPILAVFTDEHRVLSTGIALLAIAAAFQLFDGLQVVATGVLRGLGDTRTPMLTNLVAHWLLGLPIGYVLGLSLGWGVRGLWIGLSSGLIAAGVVLLGIWAWRSKGLRREELDDPSSKDLAAA